MDKNIQIQFVVMSSNNNSPVTPVTSTPSSLGQRIAQKRIIAEYLDNENPDKGEMSNILSRLNLKGTPQGTQGIQGNPPMAPIAKTRNISRRSSRSNENTILEKVEKDTE